MFTVLCLAYYWLSGKQQQALALRVEFPELCYRDVYRQPAMLFYKKTVRGAGHKLFRGCFVENTSFQYACQFVDLFLCAYRPDVSFQVIEKVIFLPAVEMLDAVPLHPLPMFHIAFGTSQERLQQSQTGSVDNADGSRAAVVGKPVAIIIIFIGETCKIGSEFIEVFKHFAIQGRESRRKDFGTGGKDLACLSVRKLLRRPPSGRIRRR